MGSTEDLKTRTRRHQRDSKNETNTVKLYNTIRDNGGIDNWTLEVIESGTVETRFEIKSRERYYYDILRADLNMIRPQASKEERRLYNIEYSEQNKDKMKEYSRQYRIANKDNIEQNCSIKVHCDACNCETRKSDIAKHKKTQKHLNNLELNNSVSKK